MASHLCKCGHCTFNSSEAKLYEQEITMTKKRVYETIIASFVQANDKLLKIKKSYNPEVGKLIQKIRDETNNLLIEMHKTPPNFNK